MANSIRCLPTIVFHRPVPSLRNRSSVSYIGAPVPDDGIKRALPGTELTFTRNEAYFSYGPADWYPRRSPADAGDYR